MKKTLLIVAALLLSLVMSAQSITSPSKDLSLVYKGAEKVGSDLEITFLLINNTTADQVVNLVGGQYQTGMSGSIAYDNEGNVYDLSSVLVSTGKKAYTEQYCGMTIPGGIGVKCHMYIRSVDATATALTKVKLCILCQDLSINNTGVCFELNNIKL